MGLGAAGTWCMGRRCMGRLVDGRTWCMGRLVHGTWIHDGLGTLDSIGLGGTGLGSIDGLECMGRLVDMRDLKGRWIDGWEGGDRLHRRTEGRAGSMGLACMGLGAWPTW